MKKVCEMTGLTYETLKFYCNKGLVPNVKRGENNYRVFDDRDVEWITLVCIPQAASTLRYGSYP